MEKNKSFINQRAFVSIMLGLTGIWLLISALLLHASSEHRIGICRHICFHLHVFPGILFLMLLTWHIVLNRRPLFKYIKSGASASRSISREAGLAVAVSAALFIMMVIYSF